MNPGAETFQVLLKRDGPGQPWGFRLQGGADFSTPLSIQSVNPGSVAECHGLKAGDAVLQINNRSSDELEHEQAKQEIVASGNSVTLVLQRGAVKIWKPKVTPMSELAPSEIKLLPDSVTDSDRYVQKTSLAADKQEVLHIGSGYNRTARPFPGSSAPANNQYNTPANLYSADSRNETFQVQATALSGGLQGDSPYLAPSNGAASAAVPGIRSVKAPVFDPNQHQAQQIQHPTCKACGSLIIGVFVRVKGDPLHPECFKCVKCGKNLKNQGYFVVEGQMFCEADARQLTNPNDPDSIAVPVYR